LSAHTCDVALRVDWSCTFLPLHPSSSPPPSALLALLLTPAIWLRVEAEPKQQKEKQNEKQNQSETASQNE